MSAKIIYNNATVAEIDYGVAATIPIKDKLMEGNITVIDDALNLSTVSVTPTESTQIITPDAAYDGIGSVTVEAIPDEYLIPNLQEKTTTINGEVTADEGYDGLSKVTVNVSKEKYDGTVVISTPSISGTWIIDISKLTALLTSVAQSGTVEQFVIYYVGVEGEVDTDVQRKYYYMMFNFDAAEFTYRIDDIEAVYRSALNGWDNDHAFNNVSATKGKAQGQIIAFESEQTVSADFYLLFTSIATKEG